MSDASPEDLIDGLTAVADALRAATASPAGVPAVPQAAPLAAALPPPPPAVPPPPRIPATPPSASGERDAAAEFEALAVFDRARMARRRRLETPPQDDPPVPQAAALARAVGPTPVQPPAVVVPALEPPVPQAEALARAAMPPSPPPVVPAVGPRPAEPDPTDIIARTDYARQAWRRLPKPEPAPDPQSPPVVPPLPPAHEPPVPQAQALRRAVQPPPAPVVPQQAPPPPPAPLPPVPQGQALQQAAAPPTQGPPPAAPPPPTLPAVPQAQAVLQAIQPPPPPANPQQSPLGPNPFVGRKPRPKQRRNQFRGVRRLFGMGRQKGNALPGKVAGKATDAAAGLLGSGGVQALSKLAGPAGLVVGIADQFGKFKKALEGATDQQVASMRQLAEVSASMAQVMAERDVRELMRDMRVGDKTASTARDLTESEQDRKDSTEDVGALFDNIKNEILSLGNDLLATVLRPLNAIAKGVGDLLGFAKDKQETLTLSEFADKMADLLPDAVKRAAEDARRVDRGVRSGRLDPYGRPRRL